MPKTIPKPHLCYFDAAHALDFSASNPGVHAVLAEFTTLRGELLGLVLSPEDAQQLAELLEALVADITRRRLGLPIDPDLWDLNPAVEDDGALDLLEAHPLDDPDPDVDDTWPDDDPRWNERWTITPAKGDPA